MDDAPKVYEIERICELQEDVFAAILPPVELAVASTVQRVEQIARHLLHHQQHSVALQKDDNTSAICSGSELPGSHPPKLLALLATSLGATMAACNDFCLGLATYLMAGSKEGDNVAVPQVAQQADLLQEALPLAG